MSAAAPAHYLFALWDGAGLVSAELTVARRLVARGHRVTVIGDPPIAADAAAVGAAFRPWRAAPARAGRAPGDDPVADWEVRSPAGLMRRIRDHLVIGPAPAYAEDTAGAIAELRPDAVVADFLLLGAHVAAEAAGLPRAALVGNIYPIPRPGAPPFGTGWPAPRAPPRSAGAPPWSTAWCCTSGTRGWAT